MFMIRHKDSPEITVFAGPGASDRAVENMVEIAETRYELYENGYLDIIPAPREPDTAAPPGGEVRRIAPPVPTPPGGYRYPPTG
jgi:hypothetical protein